jgi:hypothetical protein
VHLYLLPPELATSLNTLRDGLRLIDIEEFDNGVVVDLGRCLLLVDSTVVHFNACRFGHGVSHLTPLMHLLSDLSLHLILYQNKFLART